MARTLESGSATLSFRTLFGHVATRTRAAGITAGLVALALPTPTQCRPPSSELIEHCTASYQK
ncbi:hypothetical protein [Arthrobacter sp. 2MCAF14]|uniref:hypothetical protein n=1 Tax=Arthrobacter sp. 2MCAF14 TaxID=3232982 RepID=UPI003F93957C